MACVPTVLRLASLPASAHRAPRHAGARAAPRLLFGGHRPGQRPPCRSTASRRWRSRWNPRSDRAAVVLDRQRRLARPRPADRRAEPLADGAARVLVAIADVDALVKRGTALDDHARHNTTSVYTAGADLPDAARAALDRPDVAQRRTRIGWRVVVELAVDADGASCGVDVYRARRAQPAPSSPTTASAPGSTATARCRRRWPQCRGLDEKLRAAGRGRAAAAPSARTTHGALESRDASRRGRSSTATASRDLQRGRAATAPRS